MRKISLQKNTLTYIFAWTTAAASLAVSLMLILSTGPQLQEYFLALLFSDAPSIYGSAYQEGLAKFPSLHQWLLSSISWQFFIVAALIVLSVLRQPTSRRIFIFGALISFFTLTIFDLVIGLYDGRLTTTYVFENSISDLLGGILIGFLLLTIVLIANLCFTHLAGPKSWRLVAAAFTAVLVGVLTNTTLFFVAEFFYRPVAVTLDVVLDRPSSGALLSDRRAPAKTQALTQARKRGEQKSLFQLFPSALSDAVVRWNGEPFAVRWKALGSPSDVEIEFFGDCFFNQIEKAKSSPANVILLKGVADMRLAFDHGLNDFITMTSHKISGEAMLDFKPPLFFSLERSTDSKRFEVTQFVDKNSTLTIRTNNRDVSYYFDTVLATSLGKSLVDSARILQLDIDGKHYTVEAAKPGSVSSQSPSECRTLDPLAAVRETQQTIVGGHTTFGILVRIKGQPTSVFGDKHSELNIQGGGWITLNDELDRVRDDNNAGNIDFLGFKGNFAKFDIDGSPTSTNSIDGYLAFGELHAALEDSAKVRFWGSAKALWKNSSRLNPTKWERLVWQERAFILTIFSGALALLFRLVAPWIGHEENIAWLGTQPENASASPSQMSDKRF